MEIIFDAILLVLRQASWLWSTLALTPVERWEAARSLTDDGSTGQSFIVPGVIVVLILSALFIWVSVKPSEKKIKVGRKLFSDYANSRGLSHYERQLLLSVAAQAGLKHSESVFTMEAAFDHGASKLMEQELARRKIDQENELLKVQLSFLREKLGFRGRSVSGMDSVGKSANLSSRQIPVGKKIHMTRRKGKDVGSVESIVVKNTDAELAVKMDKPVRITFGDLWCVRYYFVSSVWEFDTSVASYDGDMLFLEHSDDVRFVNRRRFVRTRVSKPALIALFPFKTTLETSSGGCKPPKFLSGTVTELAGPGLRIEADLEAKPGDRLIVVFDLDVDLSGGISGDRVGRHRIIESIGEVRHIEQLKDGFSVAVELVGLSDTDIEELAQATNAAIIKVNTNEKSGGGQRSNSELSTQGVASPGV